MVHELAHALVVSRRANLLFLVGRLGVLQEQTQREYSLQCLRSSRALSTIVADHLHRGVVVPLPVLAQFARTDSTSSSGGGTRRSWNDQNWMVHCCVGRVIQQKITRLPEKLQVHFVVHVDADRSAYFRLDAESPGTFLRHAWSKRKSGSKLPLLYPHLHSPVSPLLKLLQTLATRSPAVATIEIASVYKWT